jgi:DNA sulfur modification protein DndB
MPKPAVEVLEVPAQEFRQSGTTMYSFLLDGRTLFDVCTITRREEDKERGYQRLLNKARANQISSYIDHRQGILPNNLIVAFKDSVRYRNGKLAIPREPDAALVIDGQHRLWGLHLAQTNLTVAVVGFIGLELVRQKELFITINRYQKGVPSSLYLDLLPEIKDLVEVDITEERAIDLVKRLNEDETSPWFNEINTTGEGRGAISLTNFVRKLRPLVSQPPLQRMLYEEQYKVLHNYFSAVQTVYLDQWRDSRTLIKKTVGFGALMESLPEIFNITTRERNREFTVDSIASVLALVGDFRFDRDNLGAGTGTAAERAAGDRFVEALTDSLRVSREEEGEGLVKL